MKKIDSNTLADAFIRPIKLVDSSCSCSQEDLKEFGFCMCGSATPYIPPKQTKILVGVDYSGSIDDDLIIEFLELIDALNKKP